MSQQQQQQQGEEGGNGGGGGFYSRRRPPRGGRGRSRGRGSRNSRGCGGRCGQCTCGGGGDPRTDSRFLNTNQVFYNPNYPSNYPSNQIRALPPPPPLSPQFAPRVYWNLHPFSSTTPSGGGGPGGFLNPIFYTPSIYNPNIGPQPPCQLWLAPLLLPPPPPPPPPPSHYLASSVDPNSAFFLSYYHNPNYIGQPLPLPPPRLRQPRTPMDSLRNAQRTSMIDRYIAEGIHPPPPLLVEQQPPQTEEEINELIDYVQQRQSSRRSMMMQEEEGGQKGQQGQQQQQPDPNQG